MTAALILLAATALQDAQPVEVRGRYRCPDQGFSVLIPAATRGVLADDPGTDSGLRIVLPSGGSITVVGEANSLEWRDAAAAARWMADQETDCSPGAIATATLGSLVGAGISLRCPDRVVSLLVGFRPGGGPVYWIRLETSHDAEAGDLRLLEQVARSFRVIRWQ